MTEDGDKAINKRHPYIRKPRHGNKRLAGNRLTGKQSHKGGEEYLGGHAQAHKKDNHEKGMSSAVFTEWHGANVKKPTGVCRCFYLGMETCYSPLLI